MNSYSASGIKMSKNPEHNKPNIGFLCEINFRKDLQKKQSYNFNQNPTAYYKAMSIY